jgi:uncharacterized membrane protein
MYDWLMYPHLVTVIPCIFIGAVLLIIEKGTKTHKTWGKAYMILMLTTACITLFMPAKVGPQILGHFGWIHSFSLLTLYTVPTAYTAIRRGDVKAHNRKMVLLYFGAIIIAGGFTFVPGRFLYEVFFN